MTNLDIFNALYPVIVSVTGVPTVILANPNAPAPSGTYCAVQVQSNVRMRGQANMYVTDGYRSIKTRAERQNVGSVTLNFYRKGAVDYANKIPECHKLPSVQLLLARTNVGIASTDGVTDLTELFDGNQEERAHVTMQIWFTSSIDDEVNNIERVPLEVGNEDGIELVNTIVEVG